MKKQYTTSVAYTSNTKIRCYHDGKLYSTTILSDWEVQGYCERLEEEGYTEAFNREEILKKISDIEEDLKFWKEHYAYILKKDAFLIGS